MASVNDWAAKAAKELARIGCLGKIRQERAAAVLEIALAPIIQLLKRSRFHPANITCRVYSSAGQKGCDCGVAAWERDVERVLAGEKLPNDPAWAAWYEDGSVAQFNAPDIMSALAEASKIGKVREIKMTHW